MGLTTLRTYADGTPRTPIPNHRRLGLDKPGYLWSQQLTGIYILDIGHHIGWIDHDMARRIIEQAQLDERDALALLTAAERQAKGPRAA